MKLKTIMDKQARENLKFEAAIQIRKLLDETRKAYGAGWEDDQIEEQISELVFGDDDE